MKYALLICALTAITFSSCQQEDELIQEIDSQLITSAIDQDTPADAMPVINDEYSASGRMMSPPGSGWTQVWSDEFNDNTIDYSKWTVNISSKSRGLSGRDPQLQWWGWTSGNTWEANGNLILRSRKHDSTTLYCGSINSNNKYETTYGYFEARIDIQDPQYGSHTAFWFQGDNQGNIDGTGNDGAEIDVFESCWTNETTKSVVHIDGYGNYHQSRTKGWSAPGNADGFHLYGLNWAPGSMGIYYDGVLKVSYGGKWVPEVDEYLWLSNGAAFDCDNSNSGAHGFSARPVGSNYKSFVDYVRVWKQL